MELSKPAERDMLTTVKTPSVKSPARLRLRGPLWQRGPTDALRLAGGFCQQPSVRTSLFAKSSLSHITVLLSIVGRVSRASDLCTKRTLQF